MNLWIQRSEPCFNCLNIAGPPPPGIPATGQPRMNPLQSLFTDPAVVSVEALEKQPQASGTRIEPRSMPPLPVAAKAASDIESDMKPSKAKNTAHGKYLESTKDISEL